MNATAHTESFAQLLEENLSKMAMEPGSIFDGLVLNINHEKGLVTIDTPFKSEGYIRLEEFLDKDGQLEIAVGDTVPVALEAIEDGYGETRLSRQKAKRQEAWKVLDKAYQEGKVVKGIIYGKVKGGFTVDINSIRAFLPGSLVDVRPVRDMSQLEGKELEFKVIKLDQKRNNVVVSRRSVVESENTQERDALLDGLQEGQVITGVVKNLTDYGAFVDLGGVDGLLHITDIAWKRVKHPSEVLTVGQEMQVKVLRFDRERMRVSLGLKQLGEDPWVGVARRYPEGTRVSGRITNIADYGCFVELEAGIEGLVHVSEMDWTNRNIHPSKIVSPGEEVEVMVLDIDEERRRISLGLKQCKASPWDAFAATHNKGDKIVGKIKSITDFGIFIGLDGGIDGLVHLSDISWNTPGEEAVQSYKKGDEVEAIVLSVDPERERISLGIKQLLADPYSNYLAEHAKGTVLTGKVTEVDAKGAKILLADGVEGYLRSSELARDRVEDARSVLTVGEEVEAKFVGVDRKNRTILLSVKAKESQEEADALRDYSKGGDQGGNATTLGDLLKEHMRDKDDE
ncbi:30S ribosomal protein S1 [Candidatus Berkiella aquae]|uniref:Small ribosomal subunit protein bS1 n=1 Tax=Candidatus Berkiella aquae TaxID=295108 RepID=A0A0Q9YP76_9GAMM|nr:30S ribosomal protein S1 [Candidatus Berkiella aquae]MCS5712022.1 30S ribosomal protein S1 [Candidatus Berkiella aquae]